jgi:hypothetical protein
MTMLSVIDCPFVQRSSKDEASRNFLSTFEVVADGGLIYENARLTVYEHSEYRKAVTGAPAKLLIVPFDLIERVDGRNIHSEHNTFEAGGIELYRSLEECRGYKRLTFKMHPDHYDFLKEAINSHFEN